MYLYFIRFIIIHSQPTVVIIVIALLWNGFENLDIIITLNPMAPVNNNVSMLTSRTVF